MSVVQKFLMGVKQKSAATDANAEDPRLRGRTYAIPFDRVWNEAVSLASGGLRRWRVLNADDHEGVIQALATDSIFRSTASVTIRIVLDENAQTRVDAAAENVSGRADLGACARHLGRFFRALDVAVAADRRPGANGR